MSGAVVRLVGVLATVLVATSARAQLCGPVDDPCVLTASLNVASGSIFDLGGRDLVIAANQTLTVMDAGFMTIRAGAITLDDGARIVANGNDGIGGDVVLQATGAIVLDPSARIDVSGGAGGTLDLSSSSLQMNGQLRAEATLRDSEGGLVTIQTTGDANVNGTGILASSGNRFGCGGYLEILAGGSISVTAPIEFRGGDCDGGDVDLDALGDVTIGAAAELNVLATYEFGSGGAISLTAGGDVIVDGVLLENGEGSFLEGGGDGGDLDIIARNVTLSSAISANGGAPDGGGGFVDVTATGQITVNGPISALGPLQGIGGDVLFSADGGIALNNVVLASAGFIGGSFDAVALGTFGMSAAASVDVSASGSAFGQVGGTVDIQACDATISPGADVIATGTGAQPRATIRMVVSNATTIGGTLNAGTAVELRYRSVLPVLQPGSIISPTPTLIADPALVCCVACESTTTTSTSSSTTTSSTASSTTSTSSSTTTSSTAPSTTTSTTAPPPPTTSTTAPPSTTTSTTEPSTTTTTTSSSSTTSSTTSSTSTVTTATSSTTSTTTSSSSSTVTTATSSTTSTTLPLTCLDEPLEGYEAVECAIGHLQDMLASQSDDALGGRRSAKRLAAKIVKTQALVEKSKTSSRAGKVLVKAERKIASFEKQIAQLLAKAKIDDGLASELLDLSGQVTVRIDGVLAPLVN
jgi:hypothetical protein